MVSEKSDTPNAWDKTKSTTEDITSATVGMGVEATNKMKSGVFDAGKKLKDAASCTKNATVDLAGKGVDAAKSGTAAAWDHTTDLTGKGTDAVKQGVEAGWNKVAGDKK